jgi:hypothetical protein
MSSPDAEADLAGDAELDLLLLCARTSTLKALDSALHIGAGLAAIRAQHERGTASRPPAARSGRGPPRETTRDEPTSHDES